MINKIKDKYGIGVEGLMAFQLEKEAWLKSVHQYCPIEIAVQPDYYEEFDAERNEWHKQSMIMAIIVLEKWLNEPEERYRSHDFEFSHLSIFVKEVTFYLHDDEHQILIERSLKVYHPMEYTSKLIDKKDSHTLLQLIDEKQNDVEYLLQVMYALSTYLEDVVKVDTKIEYCIYRLVKHLINPANDPSQKRYHLRTLTTAIHIGIENEDSQFIEEVKDCIKKLPTKKVVLNYLAYYTFSRYMQNKKWSTALLHYELLFSMLENETLDNKDFSIYCNALYILQHDITGLGVQFDRNRKMLSICLPFAKNNPAIYFNAATLYVEMDEYENALVNFIHYFASADKDKAQLLKGLESENMYATFRNYKNVKSFLNKVRAEIG